MNRALLSDNPERRSGRGFNNDFSAAELYRLAGYILLAGLYFKLRCEDPAEIVGCPTIEERDNSVDLRPGSPTAFSPSPNDYMARDLIDVGTL